MPVICYVAFVARDDDVDDAESGDVRSRSQQIDGVACRTVVVLRYDSFTAQPVGNFNFF